MISLPEPKIKGNVSLEQAISQRRSVRDFSGKPLTQDQISQILWSCQGITEKNYSLRAVPSAGALYPLEIYILTENGLMHYLPHKHSLEIISKEDLRKDLFHASLRQTPVAKAAMDIVICAVYERVTKKYSDRGVRYVHIEAGHAGQNIHLTAVSLGLGSVSIGAFNDAAVQKLLKVDKNVKPLYIIPVGVVAEE
ncbi:SagB/ThcOx family dehydrogenase [Desulfovulcanus sp.]